jgi:hypothetical protein
MSKIEELEAKRAEKLAARAKAEEAQYEKDLEARIRLEDEHGTLAGVKVVGFVPGQPTHAFVKAPLPAQYKRYKDLVQRAGDEKRGATKRADAIDQLAQDAWIYPESAEERAAMLERFPGILTPIFVAAVRLAEGKNEDEGKG